MDGWYSRWVGRLVDMVWVGMVDRSVGGLWMDGTWMDGWMDGRYSRWVGRLVGIWSGLCWYGRWVGGLWKDGWMMETSFFCFIILVLISYGLIGAVTINSSLAV